MGMKEAIIQYNDIPSVGHLAISWKPLVRCKDCQHQDDLRYEVGGKFVCRKGHGWNTDDFFCADGEPRKPKEGEQG